MLNRMMAPGFLRKIFEFRNNDDRNDEDTNPCTYLTTLSTEGQTQDLPIEIGLDDFKALAVQPLHQRDRFQVCFLHVGSPSQVTGNFLAPGMSVHLQS